MIEESIRERGDWLGASSVVAFRDLGFLLAARISGTAAEISGIGGKVEEGETFLEAIRREYREETGTPFPGPVPAPPVLLSQQADTLPIPTSAVGWIRSFPRLHPHAGSLWIAVFLGKTDKPPQPVEKIKTFVAIHPQTLLSHGWLNALQMVDENGESQPLGAVHPEVTNLTFTDTAAVLRCRADTLQDWWDTAHDLPRGWERRRQGTNK